MSGTIQFLLGGEPHAVAGLPPTTTVLQYLRRHARLTGTKEGCAEGDCGACTVLVSAPDGAGGLTHSAVNACIQFLPTLHGRALSTVEHLEGGTGRLSPVQQALVDLHGSQCGFCTPGFAVQLHAAWRNGGLGDRQAVKDAVAGNLCRCTGYGPIVEAGLRAAVVPVPPSLLRREADLAARLLALDDGAMLNYAHGGQTWLMPRGLDELCRTYASHPEATLVAGATDVGLWVTKQHRHLSTLIDVTRVPEMRRIDGGEDGSLRIGGACTHGAAHRALAALHPDLGELMRRFAGLQIRTAGTVGGNIANGSPIGDLAPALIALDATLVLNRAGFRRSLPIGDFFLAYGRQDRAPGEFVERIDVPPLAADMRFACYKLSKRFDSDISAVMAAFRVRVREGRVAEARLAFGGMAATPKRAPAAEAALAGVALDAAGAAAAAAALERDFSPITDMRASAGYRLRAAQNLIRRFAIELAGAARTRVLEAS